MQFAVIAGLALGAGLAPRPVSAAVTVPALFVAESVVPGVSWDTPTTIAFLPDGRLLVGEKRGRVWVTKNGVRHPTALWSRENEVLNDGDRGLLGIAVDPNYATNRFVYFLYTVDPDSNGVDNNDNGFGRLTRYQVSASDSNAVDASTRTILMGHNWRNGPLSDSPSHTIGGLRWGTDGSLFVSIGDGASFTQVDAGGLDTAAFGSTRTDPYEDIGAFRSQYIGSLCGKVLRINPLTGRGYASNPYVDGNLASVQSRVWAYGLRNPYRMAVRPGSGAADTLAGDPGSVYIGDVGWNAWEEWDTAKSGGQNFGWPCWEGPGLQSGYRSASPAHHDCGTVGTPSNPGPYSPPTETWNHVYPNIGEPLSGFKGNCSTAGLFYTGTRYPSAYRNKYFFADYGEAWLQVATVNASDDIVSIAPFGTGLDGPVDFAADPTTGDIYYVAIEIQDIKHIRYTGGGTSGPPIVSASATPTFGAAPLTVNFSSAGTYDPDGDPIQFSWAFGDATGSTQPNPSHLYLTSGAYAAILTVSDSTGAVGRDTVYVTVSEDSTFPTTGVLDNFNRANGPIGGAWVDETAGLSIQNNALIQTSSAATTVWNGATFGPEQEAYVRLTQITASAPEHDLMLKVQGTSWSTGHIEVKYEAANHQVVVHTYSPAAGWQLRAIIDPVTFVAGDQLGARAHGDGTVEVFRNGVLIGSAAAPDWPYKALGGRLGMTLVGATSSRLDDFGGGNVVVTSNTPPSATIASPSEGSFFSTEMIHLVGNGTDAQDPAGSLAYAWDVTILHNNHSHPSSFVSSARVDSFPGVNHDDGTGVHLEIRLVVTDTGGLTDTARVSIWPEINLTPSAVTVYPDPPASGGLTRFDFTISNTGRMPAPLSRWQLVASGTTIAAGDTVVPAQGAVTFSRWWQLPVPSGVHSLRLAADSLATVHETNETDNVSMRTINVVTGQVDVPSEVPTTLAFSGPRPNPSSGAAAFALDLPRAARVRFSVHDLQGREIWSEADRRYPSGRWTMVWDGRSHGRSVSAGLYLARVEVDGQVMVRRMTFIR